MTYRNNDTRGYIEFNDSVVNYKDGDIVIFDHVNNLSHLYPLKAKNDLVALCCQGQMSMKVNGRNVEIQTGDVLVCAANSKLEDCFYSADFDCKAICLAENIVQSLLRDKIDVWNRVVYINQINKVRVAESCEEEIQMYYSLLRSKLLNKRREQPYQIMQSLIRALLLELTFALEAADGEVQEYRLSQGKVLFNRFLAMISANEVKRQPVSVYASKLAITPKYLTMLCLKYSNKTASDWIVDYTIEDIRFLLKSSNLSIKEISAKLGFANMSHFGSYVRKHMGVSPSAVRHGKGK